MQTFALDLSIPRTQKKSTFEEQDALLQQHHHRYNPYAFPRIYDFTAQRYSPVYISERSASSVEPSSPRTPPEAAISPILDLSTSERSRDLKMISMYSFPFRRPVRNHTGLQETLRRLKGLLEMEKDPINSAKQLQQQLIAEYNENIAKHTNMRRNTNRNGNENRDKAYLEMREKNNDAARKSRIKRKAIGNSMATRFDILLKENTELRAELQLLKSYFNDLQMERNHF